MEAAMELALLDVTGIKKINPELGFACDSFFLLLKRSAFETDFKGMSLVIQNGDKPEKQFVSLKCVDSSKAFKQILQAQPHSIILTSGTLKPLTTFGAELGVNFEIALENTHVI
jgi:Rad3-related DNA helicase